jgi:hypothetical protein
MSKEFVVRFTTTCNKQRKVTVKSLSKEKAETEALELFRHLQPDIRRYDAVSKLALHH